MRKDPRPLYWSIRRELWENRSIYAVPLVVAAVMLFGFAIGTTTLPRRMNAASALDAMKQREMVMMPYDVIAGLLVVTAFLVGVFYCLDALHGERRDRSILFWKSLPVSDRVAVLAKVSVPLVVLPAIVFSVAVIAQLMLLLLSNAVLIGNRTGLSMLWANVMFIQSTLGLLYSLIAIALWHAPIYAWLLLVSALSRRATFLWAVFPLLLIAMFEKLAFNSPHFAYMLRDRVIGWFQYAFDLKKYGQPLDPLTTMTPGTFLAQPGLWIGLLFAAAFLAAAIRLRRNREPI